MVRGGDDDDDDVSAAAAAADNSFTLQCGLTLETFGGMTQSVEVFDLQTKENPKPLTNETTNP